LFGKSIPGVESFFEKKSREILRKSPPAIFPKCAFNAPSMRLQCAFNASSMRLQCAFKVRGGGVTTNWAVDLRRCRR
jgi:hypothetical protein